MVGVPIKDEILNKSGDQKGLYFPNTRSEAWGYLKGILEPRAELCIGILNKI